MEMSDREDAFRLPRLHSPDAGSTAALILSNIWFAEIPNAEQIFTSSTTSILRSPLSMRAIID